MSLFYVFIISYLSTFLVYIHSVTETVEIRTRTETRTGTATYTDPDTGETIVEEYEYEVEVAYEYYILNIKLTNRGFDAAARGLLNDEEKQLYTLYNYTYGNRDNLFDVATLPVSDQSISAVPMYGAVQERKAI